MKPYAYSKEEPEVCTNTTCNMTEMSLKSIVGEIAYTCGQANITAKGIERSLYGETETILPGEDASETSSDNMSNALIDILRLCQATLVRLQKISRGIEGD